MPAMNTKTTKIERRLEAEFGVRLSPKISWRRRARCAARLIEDSNKSLEILDAESANQMYKTVRKAAKGYEEYTGKEVAKLRRYRNYFRAKAGLKPLNT